MDDHAGNSAAIVEHVHECTAQPARPRSLMFASFELQSSMRMRFVETTNCGKTKLLLDDQPRVVARADSRWWG